MIPDGYVNLYKEYVSKYEGFLFKNSLKDDI